MKTILLTQGFEAMVDDEDFEWLNQWKWHKIFSGSHKNRESIIYACRHPKRENGKQKTILMHRVILNPSPEKQIDHIDGNGLNNQRDNLRICTASQNQMNRGKQKNNKSGFKGVHYITPTGHLKPKCRAAINIKGKVTHIGWFKNKEDAAKAYDKIAIKHFGDFAYLNFPKRGKL